MNTITKSASTNVIVAIDLGKYKSVACVCDQATGEFRFSAFDTTRAEMRKLVDKEQAVYAGRPSAPGCFFEILAQVDGLAASLLKHLPRKRHGSRPYPPGSSRCCLVVMTPWPNKAAVRTMNRAVPRTAANIGIEIEQEATEKHYFLRCLLFCFDQKLKAVLSRRQNAPASKVALSRFFSAGLAFQTS